jgi:hypothetical protein
VSEAPWLTKLQPLGEDVSVVLETADGTVRIEGETVLSTLITDPSEVPADQLAKLANWTFPVLQQAGVRYRWDGEETYGSSSARARWTRSPASCPWQEVWAKPPPPPGLNFCPIPPWCP